MIPILYIGKGHLTKASRYNLSLPIFLGIYRENPRKWGERSAKASRKVQVPSSRAFQSQPLILVYFFQLYTASNLDDFKPKGFLFKPKHILKPLSPRKLCERWCCPDTIAKAKMMVAKVSRKVLRKGYMSISRWSLGFDHRSIRNSAVKHETASARSHRTTETWMMWELSSGSFPATWARDVGGRGKPEGTLRNDHRMMSNVRSDQIPLLGTFFNTPKLKLILNFGSLNMVHVISKRLKFDLDLWIWNGCQWCLERT